MIPHRGQVHIKVYARDKPNKYGLKMYELCDSSNAYCCKLKLYTNDKTNEESVRGKTHDLLMHLLQLYLHKGHTLFVDNYYSSPALFIDLYQNGTTAIATAQNRRGIPAVVNNTKLKCRGGSGSVSQRTSHVHENKRQERCEDVFYTPQASSVSNSRTGLKLSSCCYTEESAYLVKIKRYEYAQEYKVLCSNLCFYMCFAVPRLFKLVSETHRGMKLSAANQSICRINRWELLLGTTRRCHIQVSCVGP